MELVGNSGGGNFIVGRTLNIVTKSSYGRRLAQNMTREIGPTRSFVGAATIDLARKHEIQNAIGEAEARLEEYDNQAAILADEERALKAEHQEHKRQHVSSLFLTLDANTYRESRTR
jgi:hypothetical protein